MKHRSREAVAKSFLSMEQDTPDNRSRVERDTLEVFKQSLSAGTWLDMSNYTGKWAVESTAFGVGLVYTAYARVILAGEAWW